MVKETYLMASVQMILSVLFFDDRTLSIRVENTNQ